MRVLFFTEWRIIIIELTDIIFFIFCKTDGDKKSQEPHFKYLYSTWMTRHPSREVMNFRHLLGCDTIGNAPEGVEELRGVKTRAQGMLMVK